MDVTETSLEGTIQPDGTLVLDGPTNLPPGRVEIVVRTKEPSGEPSWPRFFQMMEQIWADQRARGHVPRTAEEIEAERRSLNEEMKRELEETARLQEECQRLREEADRNAGAA